MTGGFGGPGDVICAVTREASASTAGRRLYILRVLSKSRTAGVKTPLAAGIRRGRETERNTKGDGGGRHVVL